MMTASTADWRQGSEKNSHYWNCRLAPDKKDPHCVNLCEQDANGALSQSWQSLSLTVAPWETGILENKRLSLLSHHRATSLVTKTVHAGWGYLYIFYKIHWTHTFVP
jgi:hypothetical protein